MYEVLACVAGVLAASFGDRQGVHVPVQDERELEQCAAARENQVLVLSCPPTGYISKVVFATYGGPAAPHGAKCKEYTNNVQCSASAAISTVVFKACRSKAVCRLPVDRFSHIEDPCPGYVKTLSVVYHCNSPKGTSAIGACSSRTIAGTALRSCIKDAQCGLRSNIVQSETLTSPAKWCSKEQRENVVHMMWMTPTRTFGIRNQYSLESLLRHSPCVHVNVVAPYLPVGFFKVFTDLGYNVTVTRLNMATLEPYAPDVGTPGHAWVSNLADWKSWKHFPVHLSDIVRMLVLHARGGSYMDFDHIVLRDMFHVKNGVGSEICHDDNPDCLTARQLQRLTIVHQQSLPNARSGNARTAFVDKEGGLQVRYTPCNGVLINWDAGHPVLAMLLRTADNDYDPACWGCLGPRLWGKLLKSFTSFLRTWDSSVSFTLLQPAILYPWSYERAVEHMQGQVRASDELVNRFGSLGVHFYGSTTAGTQMGVGSSMHRHVSSNALFGGTLVTCGDASNCCTAAAAGRHLLSRVAPEQYRGRAKPFTSFTTYPSDEVLFAKWSLEKRAVLMCHVDWLGIREATMKIARAIEVPVVMVRSVEPHRVQQKIKHLMLDYGLTALLIQGVPPGSYELARYLWAHGVARASVVYHSGVSVHNIAVEESGLIGEAFSGAQSRYFEIAFIENDQAAWAMQLGVPSCALTTTFVPQSYSHTRVEPAPLRIGLLGTGTRLAVKNFFTQLAAACMVPGAEIHVNFLPPGPWATWHPNFCVGNIITRGVMKSDEFSAALATMHVNLYVSWTDAVPNVVADSLAARVPVIIADTTPWFDTSPLLSHLLVEPRSDDPLAIYRRTLRVIAFVRDYADLFLNAVDKMLRASHEAAVSSWLCYARGLVKGELWCASGVQRECNPVLEPNPLAAFELEKETQGRLASLVAGMQTWDT